MADVNRGNRPLSPHMSIYRPQVTYLIWDVGRGMEIEDVAHTAWLTLAASVILTIITVVLA